MIGYLHFVYGWIAVMAWAFVALYATRKWFKSAAGWNFMLFQAAMALMFTMLVFPGGGGVWRLAVWVVGLTTVALVVTHRVILVAHDIVRDRRR